MFGTFVTSLDHLTYEHPHTLLTATFDHVRTADLAFNMLGLCYFGRDVSKLLGARRFLRLYLAGGALSFVAAIGEMYRTGNNGICMGATGAVYSVMSMNLLLDRQRLMPHVVGGLFANWDVHKRRSCTVWLVDDPRVRNIDTLAHVTSGVGAALYYAFLLKRGILRRRI